MKKKQIMENQIKIKARIRIKTRVRIKIRMKTKIIIKNMTAAIKIETHQRKIKV